MIIYLINMGSLILALTLCNYCISCITIYSLCYFWLFYLYPKIKKHKLVIIEHEYWYSNITANEISIYIIIGHRMQYIEIIPSPYPSLPSRLSRSQVSTNLISILMVGVMLCVGFGVFVSNNWVLSMFYKYLWDISFYLILKHRFWFFFGGLLQISRMVGINSHLKYLSVINYESYTHFL